MKTNIIAMVLALAFSTSIFAAATTDKKAKEAHSATSQEEKDENNKDENKKDENKK
jgi:ribosomal protein L12E/L44/L45/RPP1/RPP2